MSKFITYELDRPRNLRFGMKAIAMIEDSLGTKISKLDLSDIGIKDLAVFLWAGLAHEDKELTVSKVMDLIDDYSSIQDATDHLSHALEACFGKPEKNV